MSTPPGAHLARVWGNDAAAEVPCTTASALRYLHQRAPQGQRTAGLLRRYMQSGVTPACGAELGDMHAEMLFANRRSRRAPALYGLFCVRPMIEGPSPVPRITPATRACCCDHHLGKSGGPVGGASQRVACGNAVLGGIAALPCRRNLLGPVGIWCAAWPMRTALVQSPLMRIKFLTHWLAIRLEPTHLRLLGQSAGSERFVDDVAALNHDAGQRRVQVGGGEERVDALDQFGRGRRVWEQQLP